MNFTEMAEAIGLAEDEFLELVDLFLETSASDLGALRSAIDEQDTRQVVEAVHSLKGSAGNLGFSQIYEIARKVEENARRDSLEGASEAVEAMRKIYNEIVSTARG